MIAQNVDGCKTTEETYKVVFVLSTIVFIPGWSSMAYL